MNNIIDITTYSPKEKDHFFFDTNIWMYLFCPIGNYDRRLIAKYDNFLKKIIQKKASIFTSSLILSEFFNAYLRLEFNIRKESEPSKYKDYKKNFRSTKEYEILMSLIKTTVQKSILQISTKIDDRFCNIGNNSLFDDIEKYDFNDKYYQILGSTNNMKIVTNDRDFLNISPRTTVLTANNALIKAKI